MRRLITLILIPLVLPLSVLSPAGATEAEVENPDGTTTLVVTTTPGEDAFINSSLPTSSDGGAIFIETGHTDAGVLAPTKTYRGFLHFNLNSIPLGATVTAASLRLTTYTPTAPWTGAPLSNALDVRGLAQPFTSATSWNSQPAVDTYGVAGSSALIEASPTVDVDLGGLVQRWVAGSEPNYGVQLRTNESYQTWSWHSAESPAAVAIPTLTVTYRFVPTLLDESTDDLESPDGLVDPPDQVEIDAAQAHLNADSIHYECPEVDGDPSPTARSHIVYEFYDTFGCVIPMRFGFRDDQGPGAFGAQHIRYRYWHDNRRNHCITSACRTQIQRAIMLGPYVLRIDPTGRYEVFSYHFKNDDGQKYTRCVWAHTVDYQGYNNKGIITAFSKRGYLSSAECDSGGTSG